MNTRLLAVSCLLLSASVATILLSGPPASAQVSDPVYDIKNSKDYGIEAPKPVYHPNPEYTDEARRKKINGTVLLSIVVTPEGTVREATVAKGLSKDLDQQALKTVNTWRFKPATRDGKPVSVRLPVEMDFRLY